MASATPHLLLYSHDSYGLGHLRRTLLIAARLAAMKCRPEILVVTGSPRAQSFALPARVDTVKLPAATKDDGGGYRSRTFDMPLPELVRLRSALVEAAVDAFDPDLMLVDHAPAGLAGGSARFSTGWRPGPAGRRWSSGCATSSTTPPASPPTGGASPCSTLWTAATTGCSSTATRWSRRRAVDLGFDDRFPGLVRHVGYLGRPLRDASPPADVPFVLVTAGGGGDGRPVLEAYLSYLESLASCGTSPAFRSLLVTGPLMSPRHQAVLRERVAALPSSIGVDIAEFVADLEATVSRGFGGRHDGGLQHGGRGAGGGDPCPARPAAAAQARAAHPGRPPGRRRRRHRRPARPI